MTAALAAVGTCTCPCLLCANPQKAGAPFDKNAAKAKSYSLINANAVCCGTCQHWRGERALVENGKRVRCATQPDGPCHRGAGFKYPPTSPAASHGCVAKGMYKRWSGLA